MSLNTETILIVEDNHLLRDGLGQMLEQEGFKTFTAANGREALTKMGTIRPDLILSDIAMPVMDGYAFFEEVRKRPEWVAIPFIFLTARGEIDDILTGKGMGAEDYLIKPLGHDELVTAVRARLARSRQLQMVQMQQTYEATLTVLANAIELRDQYTRGHVERVAAYSLAIAHQLGWVGDNLEHLRFGAILHDIGKIYVPESILYKNTSLTEEEWDIVRQHPINGEMLIHDIPFLSQAAPIVRHHHERWDGQGYPDNIEGEEIPAGARIVSLADSFDAMTTTRAYQPARPLQEAYQEIMRCSGSQYDPEIVTAFSDAWDENRIQPISAAIADELQGE